MYSVCSIIDLLFSPKHTSPHKHSGQQIYISHPICGNRWCIKVNHHRCIRIKTTQNPYEQLWPLHTYPYLRGWLGKGWGMNRKYGMWYKVAQKLLISYTHATSRRGQCKPLTNVTNSLEKKSLFTTILCPIPDICLKYTTCVHYLSCNCHPNTYSHSHSRQLIPM